MYHICYYAEIPIVVFVCYASVCRSRIFISSIFTRIDGKIIVFCVKSIPLPVPTPVTMKIPVPISIEDPCVTASVMIIRAVYIDRKFRPNHGTCSVLVFCPESKMFLYIFISEILQCANNTRGIT